MFAGALVSGLAGFAFSAVAGAILLHMLPPMEAVPFMKMCSIVVQAANLWSCRQTIRLGNCFILILGGALAMPLAIYCLHRIDISAFKTGFGAFIVAYSAFMLFRPAIAYVSQAAIPRDAGGDAQTMRVRRTTRIEFALLRRRDATGACAIDRWAAVFIPTDVPEG